MRALPTGLQQLLVRLSPEDVVTRITARLLLVHGRRDPAVPFTESQRLADAARGKAGTRVVLVGVVAHVEPGETRPAWGVALRELWHLWALMLDFFAGA